MARELKMLLPLAAIDGKLVGLKKFKDALPEDLARRQKVVEAVRASRAETEDALKAGAMEKDRWHLDTVTHNGEIAKLQQNLNIVKNQKEFTIITERIKDLEEKIRGAETKELAALETLEFLEGQLKEKTRQVKTAEAELAALQQTLAEKLAEIKAEQTQLIADRQKQIAAIEAAFPDLMVLYQRALRNGKGHALVKTTGAACSGCQRKLSPNSLAIITSGAALDKALCPGCGRILYTEEAAEE